MVLQERFDWWAGRVPRTATGRSAVVPKASARAGAVLGDADADALGEPGAGPAGSAAAAEVYRAVQSSEAFCGIRRSYHGFVLPATAAFLGWYLVYLLALAAVPGLMRRQVTGPFNIAWLLGLGQFASVFLLTWLYARNARTKRDRAALELRWDTQDQLR